MTKKQFILDTSLFVNPASAQAFGNSPTESFTHFLELAKKSDAQFLMPPSIYSELMYFAEESKIPKGLLSVINQKPPKKHELMVPGYFIYLLVESFRDRVDRGLRLSERHVREALETPQLAEVEEGKKSASDRSKVRPDGKLISGLRESFRRMMREGMLDSKADVDLLLLAYEIKGALVSADEGVLAWAEHLGIEILPYPQLFPLLSAKIP